MSLEDSGTIVVGPAPHYRLVRAAAADRTDVALQDAETAETRPPSRSAEEEGPVGRAAEPAPAPASPVAEIPEAPAPAPPLRAAAAADDGFAEALAETADVAEAAGAPSTPPSRPGGRDLVLAPVALTHPPAPACWRPRPRPASPRRR